LERTEVYSLIENHYKAHQGELVKKLRNAVNGHHNAEDTVQEAYTRALKYWDTYDSERGLDKWFSSILRNCIKDTQKDSILKGMVLEDMMNMPEPQHDDVFNNVAAGEIVGFIEKEPKHHQLILRSYLVMGYTSAEIAEFTGYKPDAVRQIISRFAKKFREV